ncbi:hypothetical protein TGDOM2_231130C, partial [Toxoplasma gondii GAB2-2007-GAL-DOM2]
SVLSSQAQATIARLEKRP